MGARERLLLKIAATLHDCGKFVSITRGSESSYQIIMDTEIIGISHLEREVVANIVRYNIQEYAYDEVILSRICPSMRGLEPPGES
ncbi:MAG: HD domain-containing protein [Clostridium fessum]